MKKLSILFAGTALAQICSFAQPNHTVVSGYNTAGYAPGYANSAIPAITGYDHDRYDVACGTGFHLQAASVIVGIYPNEEKDIAIVKKDESTGATISTLKFDINTVVGAGTPKEDIFQAMMLDEVNGRIYIVGYTLSPNRRAFIACIRLSTMTLSPTFGTGGVLFISSLTENVAAIDVSNTGTGNLVVLCNATITGGRILALYSVHPTSGALTGYTAINHASWNYYGNRIRRSPNTNQLAIAGYATNSTGSTVPMVWRITNSLVAPFTYSLTGTSTHSFTGAMGQGRWNDIGFFGTSPAYSIVVGGTNLADNGIWGRYNVSTMTPDPAFTNTIGTIPGSTTLMPIDRLLIDPDNFITVIGKPLVGSAGHLGHINNTGVTFTLTHNFNVSSSMGDGDHFVAINKQIDGEIVAAGCGAPGFCTVKFNGYTGPIAWNEFVNKIANQDIDSTSGENEISPLIVYPNPSSGKVVVAIPDGQVASLIEITDMNGKLVSSQKGSFSGSCPIDIDYLPAGIYTIKTDIIAGKSYLQKLIKK